MKLNTYHIEVTDTFGGEANYCWKREYMVRAHTMRGAIQVLARKDGALLKSLLKFNFNIFETILFF